MKRLLLWVSLFLALACNMQKSDLPRQVAAAYGIQNFDKIQRLAFDIHIKNKEEELTRRWVWWPQKDSIVLQGPDTTGFSRKGALTQKLKMIDSTFVRDTYWLLFPFHLQWNRRDFLTLVEEKATAPISGKSAKLLTVQFKEVMYSPRDAYDLYLTKDNKILEWTWRAGGDVHRAIHTTWEKNQKYGGIILSTFHQNKDGSFRVWFDNIKINNQ